MGLSMCSKYVAKLNWQLLHCSIDERVADILGRLTKEEKINALGTNTGKLDSIGLNQYNWYYLHTFITLVTRMIHTSFGLLSNVSHCYGSWVRYWSSKS